MSVTTITSRHLSRNVGRAKKAAEAGPVVITERGRPSLVLLTYNDFLRLEGQPVRIAELLAMPGKEDIELPIPPRTPARPLHPVDTAQ